MDDDRTPPSVPRRVTERRVYDVEQLLILAVGDLSLELHPYELGPAAKEKIRYWLSRAWDNGRSAAERG